MNGPTFNRANLRHQTGTVAAVLALLIVGGLTLRAASGARTVPLQTALATPAVHLASQTRLSTPATSATATATATPHQSTTVYVAPQTQPQTASSTPAPTATDTPAPTPTTAPTATATPAPSWHTVGTYSGTTGNVNVPTFTAIQWRVTYTCTPATDGVLWSFGVSWPNAGQGYSCTSTHTGDTIAPCTTGLTCDTLQSWTITIGVSQPPADAGASWSATVEAYY